MARTHARIQGEIWANAEWRVLRRDAQWAYVLLLSQPQINNCGVLPLTLRRWSALSAGTTVDDLLAALHELEEWWFIVCDYETEEVLVRTFIRHDRVERQPNVLLSAERQFREVQSARIREVLRAENPHLFAESKPLPKDLREPLSEALREGVNARVPSPSPTTTPAPTPAEPGEHDRADNGSGRVGGADLSRIDEDTVALTLGTEEVQR